LISAKTPSTWQGVFAALLTGRGRIDFEPRVFRTYKRFCRENDAIASTDGAFLDYSAILQPSTH
jgi:predicted alpha/beta hydrolase